MTTRLPLARKYRPGQLADLVGQAATVRTLANALKLNRLHHAYLFTGPRGVGKTTTARILAKLLRCVQVQEVDGLPRSCDQCADCRDISRSVHVDVLEIDGASNNGVESVRQLREGAQYSPSSGQRKIYLIDEVHMLTTAAFNALLKTLEEPPEGLIFLFATTEVHKVPSTILSRVQTFEAQRIGPGPLAERLGQIARSENLCCEEPALRLIAQKSSGSVRDALSLLDQSWAYAGNETLTVEHVSQILGLSGSSLALEIISGITSRNIAQSLPPVQVAYDRGDDLRTLLQSLITYLHALLVLRALPSDPLLHFSPEERESLSGLSSRRAPEEFELIFQVLHQGLEWVARSFQPKLILDVLIIKCTTAEILVPAGPAAPLSSVPSAPPSGPIAPQPPLYQPTNYVSAPLSHEGPAKEVAKADPAAPLIDRLYAFLQNRHPLVASIVQHTCSAILRPGAETGESGRNILTLSFQPADAYFKDQLRSGTTLTELHELATEFFKEPTLVRIQLEANLRPGESPVEKKRRLAEEEKSEILRRAENHPLLRQAQRLFGGSMGPVRLTAPSP